MKQLVDAGLDMLNRDQLFLDTPLHGAVKRGNAELVAYLLYRCADPLVENKNGRTAVDEAARHPDILEMVSKHYCGVRKMR